MPCARMTSQKFLHRETIIMAKTVMTEPTQNIIWFDAISHIQSHQKASWLCELTVGPKRSRIRPVMSEPANMRKILSAPIHPIFESLSLDRILAA